MACWAVQLLAVEVKFLMCSNGVIDREELRALLESTDSGSQYALTVSTSPLLKVTTHLWPAIQVRFPEQTLTVPALEKQSWGAALMFTGVRQAYALQHWLEDDDLDRIMKNYDENADGRHAPPLSSQHQQHNSTVRAFAPPQLKPI
jgi:hypothetical protein